MRRVHSFCASSGNNDALTLSGSYTAAKATAVSVAASFVSESEAGSSAAEKLLPRKKSVYEAPHQPTDEGRKHHAQRRTRALATSTTTSPEKRTMMPLVPSVECVPMTLAGVPELLWVSA